MIPFPAFLVSFLFQLLQDISVTADHPDSNNDIGAQLVQNQKKENIIDKSLVKLKETTTV